MISDKTYKSILKSCNFSQEAYSSGCEQAISYATNHEFGAIDQYSIYTPTCKAVSTTTNYTVKTIRFKNSLLHRRVSGYDPCTENYAEKYYNRPDVQKAFHANTTGIPYKWTACRYFPLYSAMLHISVNCLSINSTNPKLFLDLQFYLLNCVFEMKHDFSSSSGGLERKKRMQNNSHVFLLTMMIRTFLVYFHMAVMCS